MLSVKDFVEKYSLYTDEELFEVNSTIDGYSDEAKEALDIVINNRGGIERIEGKISGNKIILNEINRIKAETRSLSSKETNIDLIKTLVISSILPKEKVSEVIDEQYASFEAHVKDTAIDSKIVVKAAIGTLVASILGAIYMGVILATSNPRMPIFFIIGLLLLCYAIISLITRKSKANNVVFLATAVSFILSIILGYLIAGFY